LIAARWPRRGMERRGSCFTRTAFERFSAAGAGLLAAALLLVFGARFFGTLAIGLRCFGEAGMARLTGAVGSGIRMSATASPNILKGDATHRIGEAS